MFTRSRTAEPMRVSVARGGSDRGLLWEVLAAGGRLIAWTLSMLWHCPFLTAGLAVALAARWAADAAGWWAAVAGPLVLAVGVCLACWRWPALRVRAVDSAIRQATGLVLFRPRWEMACKAGGLAPRIGSMVHLPGLARHRHRRGVATLTVRMAPGQTLADWQAGAASVASTFCVHAVTVRDIGRPGWVCLDVLRRDPLGGERTMPDPARHRTGPIVLGRDETGASCQVDPYGAGHLAIQGATRSGKSALCYGLLAALAHRPEVIVTGVDPSGLLLGPFTVGRGGAWIATGTRDVDLDAAADTLARLVALMDERISQLAASRADKLTLFSPGRPAVWVVLEEYPGLLSAARALDGERGAKPGARLAARIERAVGRLIKEGAKVGVSVAVIAQRMSAGALDTDDRANLATRITLRVDNGDAVAMLHDGLDRCHLDRVRQFAPGVALLESPGTPLRRVRFHYTDYATFRARVEAGIDHTRSGAPLTLGTVIAGQVIPREHPDPAAPTAGPATEFAGAWS